MRDELARTMDQLHLDTLPKPYFVAYRVDDIDAATVAGSLGSLLYDEDERRRLLVVELRVGDYQFDNTNFFGMPTGFAGMARGGRAIGLLPLDDDYRELRRQLWLATDAAYKQAIEAVSQKRAALQNQIRSDSLPDFSHEPVVAIADTELASASRPDLRATEALVRTLSAEFRGMSDIFSSRVQWTAGMVRTRYVNSEGTSFVRSSPWTSVRAEAATQAVDGMALSDVVAAYGATVADLPSREALRLNVQELGTRLTRLRQAAPADAYNGPVLFEGQAAAELFNQVFAPNLVASRRPVSGNPLLERLMARSGNRFQDELGARVLPRSFSAVDNPTVTTFEGQFVGGYRVDDDGVLARETRVVDHGILKTLLTTRVPVRGMPRSTGNRWGFGAVVSNLFVSVDSGLTAEQLKDRLLRLATERGLAYGVIVRRIANPAMRSSADPMALLSSMGGSSSEGTPTLVAALAVKVYADGHEESIRNADISGISTATFKEIVAASQSRTVYTTPFRARFGLGFGGAGLGYAATYIVPSVLFDDVSLSRPSAGTPALPALRPPQ